MSLIPECKGLLTAEQVLADYAELVQKEILPKFKLADDTFVVAVGGSLGGMYAAWARYKYPNVFSAALSASGPVRMMDDSIDPTAYFAKVTQDFANADATCPDLVRKGYNDIRLAASTGTTGADELMRAFNLCAPVATSADVEHLELFLRNALNYLAMLDYPYATNFLGPLPGHPVNVACGMLKNNSMPLLNRLGGAAGLFYQNTTGTCLDMYALFRPCADRSGCGGSIAWDVQSCTEMGMLATTNNVTDMFPPTEWTLQDLTSYCQETYGLVPRRDWTVRYFGGGNLKAASRIIFSNGDLDPWSTAGITTQLADDLPAVVIEQAAHHLDLRGTHAGDPESVTKARAEELAYLTKWLAEDEASRAKPVAIVEK